jgi:hypothetical protein
MAANIAPIFALTPYTATFTGDAVGTPGVWSACTTRLPTVAASLAAAKIFPLTVVSTNGKKIDKIRIKASSSSITAASASQLVTIWYHDGTNAFPLIDIQVNLITPSTTSGSFETEQALNITLPAAHTLYVSTTIATTAATTALSIFAFGGDF